MTADAGIVLGDSLIVGMAAFRHDGALRRALAALKYVGSARLAPLVAHRCADALRRLLVISGDAALIPVPVHRDRRRSRGYNQAELLARALGSALDLRVTDVLERRLPTTRQHRLDRSSRLRNLRGAFAIRPGVSVPPVAIIVDDIVTTVATLETCAGVLSAAGCQAVYGFAVAREV